VRIELAADCITVARSHDALELLRARYHAALGGDPSRVALDRLIDTQHRVLRPCQALLEEVARCDASEEEAW
jgi:hypothetical protein